MIQERLYGFRVMAVKTHSTNPFKSSTHVYLQKECANGADAIERTIREYKLQYGDADNLKLSATQIQD